MGLFLQLGFEFFTCKGLGSKRRATNGRTVDSKVNARFVEVLTNQFVFDLVEGVGLSKSFDEGELPRSFFSADFIFKGLDGVMFENEVDGSCIVEID